MQPIQLSQLMRLSWQIQRSKKCNRSKSLVSAWVIFQNSDLMVYHLVKKHTPETKMNKVKTQNVAIIF